jgi:8-oxo-dGTP pyrophosphatase MutT (NUDIX family)
VRQKNFFLVVVFILSCGVVAPGLALDDFKAAGASLVSGEGQSRQVLLVKHHGRSWYEMPGGRRKFASAGPGGQGTVSETAYETAIRECHEESRSVLSLVLLRDSIDPSHQLRDGSFVYFVGTIDRVPADALRQVTIPRGSGAFGEIADYAWVDVDRVLVSESDVVIDSEGRSIRVRPQLSARLRRARGEGWL